MQDQDGETHIETDDARGGTTPNIMRWVLGIGLLLAIVAMSLAWLIPALSRGGETQNVNVSREIVTGDRSDGSSTDSIVTPDAGETGAAPTATSTGSDTASPAAASAQ